MKNYEQIYKEMSEYFDSQGLDWDSNNIHDSEHMDIMDEHLEVVKNNVQHKWGRCNLVRLIEIVRDENEMEGCDYLHIIVDYDF